jgi:NTP pyrophosphatase (non-canonical NTP hydrolase)
MELNTYQEQARSTAIYPNLGSNIIYPSLGICGEAGEVAEKVKKIIRDDGGVVTDVKRDAIAAELGDILWYVSQLAAEIDYSLDDIAQMNLDKLFSRKERGVIAGSGDNR